MPGRGREEQVWLTHDVPDDVWRDSVEEGSRVVGGEVRAELLDFTFGWVRCHVVEDFTFPIGRGYWMRARPVSGFLRRKQGDAVLCNHATNARGILWGKGGE